jgi:hypothetical protein
MLSFSSNVVESLLLSKEKSEAAQNSIIAAV